MHALLFAGVTATSACGATCQNVAYDVDPSQPGADTPLGAIDAWRNAGSEGMSSPPEDGWEVPDDLDQEQLTLVNPEADWVVDLMRTEDGGWVVSSAQADCS